MAADAADKADAGVDLPDAPDTALGRKLKLLS